MEIIHKNKEKTIIRTMAALCSALFMLSAFMIFGGGAKAYAQDGYAWVLVEKKNYDSKEALAKYNQDTEDGKNLYRYELNCSPGNYTGRVTYTGGENKSSNPPTLKGETLAAQAVFSGVPDIIYPGQKVNLSLSLSVLDKNLSFYSWNAMAFADFNPPDAEPSGGVAGYPAFRNDSGNNWFEINKGNNWKTFNETISAEYRAGKKEGERMALRTRFRFSNWSIGTNHIYEWKVAGKDEEPAVQKDPVELEPVQDRAGPEVQTPSVSEPQSSKEDTWPKNYAPKDENGNYIDSGIRVGWIGGEVLIRHGDQRLGWEMVEPGTIVYEGDVVFAKSRDAECELSLPDMTVFVMKPASQLTINYDSTKRETTVAILSGKVWANIKRMIKDGSMNVELSQLAAGIKGTILICESGEQFSCVQVIEGEVEVTDLKGNKVLLGAGEQVTAQDGALGKEQEFSIEEELQNWPEKTREQAYKDIEERTGEKAVQDTAGQETGDKKLLEEKIAEHERHEKTKLDPKYLLGTAIIGLAAGTFIYVKKRRN